MGKSMSIADKISCNGGEDCASETVARMGKHFHGR